VREIMLNRGFSHDEKSMILHSHDGNIHIGRVSLTIPRYFRGFAALSGQKKNRIHVGNA
jgi:hypothetical protein